MKRKFLFMSISFILIMLNSLVMAEIIILKSGKKIEGKIVEQTKQYIKVEVIKGLPITYWIEDLAQINGETVSPPADNFTQPVVDSSKINEYRIKAIEAMHNKRYNEAKALMEKAIELEPNNSDLYAALGLIYWYLNNLDQAAAYLQKSLALQPDNASLSLCLGVIYDFMGNKEEAIRMVNNAINQFNDDSRMIDVVISEIILKKISQ